MKKETKELVQWIIKRLEHLKSEAIESGTLQTELPKEYEKAFTFLKSLSEIESHLCRGGYIQDKNGTPCCDGDKIVQKVIDDDEIGILYWSKSDSRFYFKNKQYIGTLSKFFKKIND